MHRGTINARPSVDTHSRMLRLHSFPLGARWHICSKSKGKQVSHTVNGGHSPQFDALNYLGTNYGFGNFRKQKNRCSSFKLWENGKSWRYPRRQLRGSKGETSGRPGEREKKLFVGEIFQEKETGEGGKGGNETLLLHCSPFSNRFLPGSHF